MDNNSNNGLKLIFTIGVIVGIVGVVLFAMNQPSKAPTTTSTMSTGSVMKMDKAGVFANYSPEALTKTEGHKNILFFSATWCPTCQATNKDIQANLDKIDSKLHILSVDYDTNTDLRSKYGVTMQHTFVVIDSSGNLVKKTNGLGTVSAINAYSFE